MVFLTMRNLATEIHVKAQTPENYHRAADAIVIIDAGFLFGIDEMGLLVLSNSVALLKRSVVLINLAAGITGEAIESAGI